MAKIHSKSAGGGKKKDREEFDFYETPAYATEDLFKYETFEGEVWECAAGHGAMSKVIEKYNPCFSSDIRTNDEVHGVKGFNFLNCTSILMKDDRHPNVVDNIITNPPYTFTVEFIETAKKVATKKIAMLLRLPFIESQGRYELFQDKEFPLAKIYVYSERVNMTKNGAGGAQIAFSWYVWEKEWKGEPVLRWIKPKSFLGG